MIDFHTHILPEVDDGSKSVEETFELIKEAKEVGFDTIISTSHYIENYYNVNVKDRTLLINAISEALTKQNIDLKLYLGNEVYFSEHIIEMLKNRQATTINNSRYLLFEFPMNTKPLNIYDVVYELLQWNLVPVLAHPERYSFVQKEPELIYDLIQKGVLMQSNYGSIIGRYGEKAQIIVKKLFQNNMVHFLGSDVHKINTIYPKIPMALKEIEEIIGEEKLEELTTINPKLAIENKSIDIDEPTYFKLTLKEKMKINLK